MRAIDRCANDFAYLNDSLQGREQGSSATAERLADLMEAVYELEGDEQDEVAGAAEGLLKGLGFRAVPYSAENSRLFTVLPSKNETRTLSPAIVSAEDFRLIRPGNRRRAAGVVSLIRNIRNQERTKEHPCVISDLT